MEFFKRQKDSRNGYELFPSYQGKDLMDEALKCVINLGFQKIGPESVEAYTHNENTGSIHLLERNDFKLDTDRIGDTNANNIIYNLTR